MKTLEFRDGVLWLIDQTKLPLSEEVLPCRTYQDVAEAIRSMKVRGAPAIGLTAAYGLVLAANDAARRRTFAEELVSNLQQALSVLRGTRPTAVNLFWALDRVWKTAESIGFGSAQHLAEALRHEADRMLMEDEAANRAMGRYGAELIPAGANVLTHCNAGALATGAFGTAVGVLQTAHEQGKCIHVWVDETRPLLQGARLTAWELQKAGVPFTLITDNMAAHVMGREKVDVVMVGADRIVANGDGANKIGTYGLAVLAGAHGIPFYFVAPTSTIDPLTSSGAQITIEERDPEEVTTFRGLRVAPDGVEAFNPAFDVTPARLVSAIVTERGIARAPYEESLGTMVNEPTRPMETPHVALVSAEAT